MTWFKSRYTRDLEELVQKSKDYSARLISDLSNAQISLTDCLSEKAFSEQALEVALEDLDAAHEERQAQQARAVAAEHNARALETKLEVSQDHVTALIQSLADANNQPDPRLIPPGQNLAHLAALMESSTTNEDEPEEAVGSMGGLMGRINEIYGDTLSLKDILERKAVYDKANPPPVSDEDEDEETDA